MAQFQSTTNKRIFGSQMYAEEAVELFSNTWKYTPIPVVVVEDVTTPPHGAHHLLTRCQRSDPMKEVPVYFEGSNTVQEYTMLDMLQAMTRVEDRQAYIAVVNHIPQPIKLHANTVVGSVIPVPPITYKINTFYLLKFNLIF